MNFLENVTFLDARKFQLSELNLEFNKVSVMHLINDHELRAFWESQIASEISADEITQLINLQAINLRQEFESALDSFASKQTVFWLATRTAEKNTLINPFFLNILFLTFLKDFKFKYKNKLVFTDNEVLLNLQVDRFRLRHRVKFSVQRNYKAFKTVLQFAALFFGNKLQSYGLPRSKTEVVVHSFVDNESLSTLIYRERYFPGLVEWYETQGISASLLISGAGSFPLKLYKSMLRKNLKVFNEYRFYGVRDFIFALRIFLKLRLIKFNDFFIDGEDFSNISDDIHNRYGTDLGVLEALLRYRLGFKLKLQENYPRLFVTEYEGMILEKMLNLGIHSSGAQIEVYGFQHGAMFEHLICNYPTNYELSIGIIPDKIICNGQKFSELIISRGVPSSMVFVGSALRYTYLHKGFGSSVHLKDNSIVVLLPMTYPDCKDLISIFEDFSIGFNVEIHYKPHPFNDISLLLPLLKSSNNKFLYGSISEIIFNYKIVVGMTTGALLEAGLLGLCVVKIKRLLSLDFDTTFMDPELRVEVEDISDLSSVLVNLLNEHPFDTPIYNQSLLDSYFAPINPSGMEKFLI